MLANNQKQKVNKVETIDEHGNTYPTRTNLLSLNRGVSAFFSHLVLWEMLFVSSLPFNLVFVDVASSIRVAVNLFMVNSCIDTEEWKKKKPKSNQTEHRSKQDIFVSLIYT